MKSFKARGIVLRENPVGESDKYVGLLLKGIGKLSVSARGARKPGSKFLAGTQPFTYSDFVIYDGGKFHTMSQIDIIEGFYGLQKDYDKLCCANYILELCDKVIKPGEECDDILLLLLKTLSFMSRDQISSEYAARVFEIKFLQLCGFIPDLQSCTECGSAINERAFFCPDGCICNRCIVESTESFPVSTNIIEAITYISATSEPARLFSFEAGRGTLDGMKRAAEIIFNSHIDVRIKSKDLL